MNTEPSLRLMETRFDPSIPHLLPHENMYKIQVGSRLFQISGASLSSDGPSFFTDCFSKQDGGMKPSNASGDHKVLFIDRSAEIFQLIYTHLQGYFIDIKNEVQYTMLYADAMYYNLPRLRSILKEYEYYFTNISGRTFKIAKSLFRRKGDSPNFFLMTYDALYSDVEALFMAKKLLRPPPQSPPYVPRSPEFFQDLLELLGGASIDLDDKRRESLIKECRYYRFLNLEQRLIKSRINYNPITKEEDIYLSLDDLNKKSIYLSEEKEVESQVTPECFTDLCPNTDNSPEVSEGEPPVKKLKAVPLNVRYKKCWNICSYKRPYLDEYSRDLVFQIDAPECTLIFNKRKKIIHVALANNTARQFEMSFSSALNEVGINLSKYKVKFPAIQSSSSSPSSSSRSQPPHLVLPACISICDLNVNGHKCPNFGLLVTESKSNEQVLDFTNVEETSYCPGMQLYLSKSVWKFGAKHGKIMMIALKAESFNGTKEFCKMIEYL